MIKSTKVTPHGCFRYEKSQGVGTQFLGLFCTKNGVATPWKKWKIFPIFLSCPQISIKYKTNLTCPYALRECVCVHVVIFSIKDRIGRDIKQTECAKMNLTFVFQNLHNIWEYFVVFFSYCNISWNYPLVFSAFLTHWLRQAVTCEVSEWDVHKPQAITHSSWRRRNFLNFSPYSA